MTVLLDSHMSYSQSVNSSLCILDQNVGQLWILTFTPQIMHKYADYITTDTS